MRSARCWPTWRASRSATRTRIRRARSSSSAASSSTWSPPSTSAYRLRPPFSDNLNDLMTAEAFRQSVPEVVQNKLHAVRKAGNHAAHPRRPITSQLSLECLEPAVRHRALVPRAGRRRRPPGCTRLRSLRRPSPKAPARRGRRSRGCGSPRRSTSPSCLRSRRRRRSASMPSAPPTDHATELAQLKEEGQKVASFLQFNEETTRRRLIDQALVAAGWNVGAERREHRGGAAGGSALRPCRRESGEGFADYVLYGDDGKPLAVIEAKKTVEGCPRRRRAGAHVRRHASRRRPACARSSSSPTASTSSSGTTRRATRTARSTASTRRTASST